MLAANPYATAVANTPPTGAHIAELIEFLVAQTGVKLEDFHIIGHSLGAQVAGFTGKSTTTGKVGRITGLWCSVEETSVGLGPLSCVKHILSNRCVLAIHHHLLNSFDAKKQTKLISIVKRIYNQ